jgi:hypothetical protein
MWLLCFIGGLSYCGVTIVECIMAYFDYQVTVSITKINELPATFPAVTFCNVNPFNIKYAIDFIEKNVPGADCFRLINGEQINKEEFQKCFLESETADVAFTKFIKTLRRVVATKNISDSERMHYGYQLGRDMLVSCSFNGITCTEDDFIWSWSNIYGNCYTFNTGNDTGQYLKTSVTRDSYGLYLELVVSKFKF